MAVSKIYYTEHIKFEPMKAWAVVGGPDRRVIGLHHSRRAAEKQCITALVDNPEADVTFTKCVVLPNFSLKG